MLEQAAQVGWGGGAGVCAAIPAGFQKLTGQGSGVIGPALGRVVGLSHLQSFLPTSAVL